jgi:hypothetical protein
MRKVFAVLMLSAISEASQLTNGVASQSSYRDSVTPENAVDSLVSTLIATLDETLPGPWGVTTVPVDYYWVYALPGTTLINTFFIVTDIDDPYIDNWESFVGDEFCANVGADVSAKGKSGWYTCSNPILGRDFLI